jgi:hypothetical protein
LSERRAAGGAAYLVVCGGDARKIAGREWYSAGLDDGIYTTAHKTAP